MRKPVDLRGKRFTRLTAIRDAGPGVHDKHRMWECLCDCGKTVFIPTNNLSNENSKSCGCLAREAVIKRNKDNSGSNHPRFRHGHALNGRPSLTYSSWTHMINRCTNPKYYKYYLYGGQGIEVCERWTIFDNFLSDMGERPKGTTLSRFMDSGNYSPDNCAWHTPTQQAAEQKKKKALNALLSSEDVNNQLPSPTP